MLFDGRLIISPQLEVLTVPGHRSATVWPWFRLPSTCLLKHLLSAPSLASCLGVRYVSCLSISVPRPWHSFMLCIKSGQTFHMRKTLKPRVWLERLTAANGNSTSVELIVTRGLRVLMLREAVRGINRGLVFLLSLSFLSSSTPPLLLLSILVAQLLISLSCPPALVLLGRRRRSRQPLRHQFSSRLGAYWVSYGLSFVHGL